MPMSRRTFIGAGAAALAASQSLLAGEAQRPNLIFLLSDDQPYDCLGCMGNPVVQTPAIDALARDGVLFTHACVTTSICCCSRATILTGEYVSRHHIRDFATRFTPEALDQTYPSILRRNGYYTGFIGKYGVGNKAPVGAFDFDRATAQLTAPWVTDREGKRVHVIEQDTGYALDFLRERPADRPFCLSLSFRAPHAQDGNPKQYLFEPEDEHLYEDVKIPVPPTATEKAFEALPPFLANEQNEGRRRWRWRFDTPERYQEYVKAYYRLVTEMDRGIGRIVAGLKERGLDKNTVIIFMGDNGYFLGEKGLADKWYPYEESLRVPLVLFDPRLPARRRGVKVDDFALNVDIAPTLLAMAGCAIPAGMQGRDLSPLCRGERPADWPTDFYYEHPFKHPGIPMSEALVTHDAKYILWPAQNYEELFDLRADPREEHNLAGDPAHKPLLERMRRRFEELKRRAP